MSTQAVSQHMQLKCRCHGISGSCELKTCWRTIPSFDVIGNYLKAKYSTAIRVSGSSLHVLIIDTIIIIIIISLTDINGEDWKRKSKLPESTANQSINRMYITVVSIGITLTLTGRGEGSPESLRMKVF